MSDVFATPWTVTHQAPLSMGFPRQKCWSGLPHLLLQEIVLTQGSNFCLLHWLVDSLPLTYTHRTWEKRGVRGRILVTKFFIEVCNSFYMIQFLIWKKILTVIRTYTIKWREMNMGIVIHLFILKKSSLINFYYQRYV